jgi:dienelactone hydrolase
VGGYNSGMHSQVLIPFAALLLLCGTSCPQAKPPSPSAKAAATTASSQAGSTATEIRTPPSFPAPVGAQSAWLTTSDGYKVAAWFWPARTKPANGAKVPALILLHQRAKDKSSWGGFADELVAEGYAVIAIDLRGHGQTLSPQGQPIPLDSLSDADYQAMLSDVAAAHEYVAQQSGVDGDRVGIIGASIGANLGLLYAGGDRRIRTVVALSPGLNYRSLQPLSAMSGLDKRPLFLISSKGDKPSADACSALQKAAVKEAPVSVRMFDGTAHGTDLLAANAGLDQTIISGWLLNYLPPASPPVT